MFVNCAIKTAVIHSDFLENVNGILLLRSKLEIDWRRGGTGAKEKARVRKNESLNFRLINMTRLRADLISMLFGQRQFAKQRSGKRSHAISARSNSNDVTSLMGIGVWAVSVMCTLHFTWASNCVVNCCRKWRWINDERLSQWARKAFNGSESGFPWAVRRS